MKRIKKMFSGITKKTIYIVMTISLLVNNFVPIMTVFAATWDDAKNYSEYYQIQLNNYNSANIATNDKNAVITYEHGRASINGDDITIKDNVLYSSSKIEVDSVMPSDNYDYQIWYDGGQISLEALNTNLSSLAQNERKNVDFMFQQKQSGKVTFQNATSISGSGNSMTVSYEHGSVSVTGTDLQTASDDGGKYIYSYNVPQSLSITATADEEYVSRINGNLATTYMQPLNKNDNINLNIDFEDNNGGNNNPGQPTNKSANIILNHNTNATYQYEGESKNFEIGADVSINGFMLDHGESTLNYAADNGATTVTFNFSTLWHLKYYDSIVINGTSYNVSDYLDYDNQKAWLDHYDRQIVGFDIPNVPIADTYNISVKVGRQQGEGHIANFLWTGDPAQKNGEDYIGNAHLEMVGLEYTVGGTKYTYNENDFKSGSFDTDYVEYNSDESLSFDEGSLVIPAGSKVTMRITPKYGYQVISANLAQSGLTTTDDGVCEFTFTIGGGAAYFTADVVKFDDEVKAESEKVSSGDIKLPDGTVNSGTVRLSVNDIELDSTKTKAFENAAGDYNIKSYLDIDLDQIFLRGEVNSFWSNRIHELDDYATITLKLEDGVDGNDIVIVHNINDGDEYEVIPIESYDPETNTITFKTKSFSNYAIASKTTTNTTNNSVASNTTSNKTNNATTSVKPTSNPQTGDNIRMYINLFILSAGGLAIATLQLKKRRKFAKNN